MRSVMQHQFGQVPTADIPRSSFDLSHGHKTTFDAGYLIPILVTEALPGDTWNVNMKGFARMATPIHPVMDNQYMDTHFFSIPMRLLWNNFEKFMGEREDPGDSIDFTIPVLSGTTVSNPTAASLTAKLLDYMGVPFNIAPNDVDISAMFFRAYHLVWNEWFRSEQLQDSVTVQRGDGPDTVTLYELQKRGKRHDYFTSCLPAPQLGDAVTLPLGVRADVKGIGNNTQSYSLTNVGAFESDQAFRTYANAEAANLANEFYIEGTGATSAYPNIYADLSTATAATINQLRLAFQTQKLLERDARSGTRYPEVIMAHFGVHDPRFDVLERPEYLGGGSTEIRATPIAQTSSTDATTPQGNLAAYATAGIAGHGFSKSFSEHCIILGLVSTRADLTYQQGLDRMFSRSTRYDFYWPALSSIGEQSVLNKEIYTQGTTADDDVFGYMPRYDEYRHMKSRISGYFRSNITGSLDAWHLSQDFDSLPTLGDTFIKEDPPVVRVIALPSEPHYIFDSYFNCHVARPMPVHGVPGLIDHF